MLRKVEDLLLPAVGNFTNDALNFVKRVGLNGVLMEITPILRHVLALLVWITSFGSREVGRKVGPHGRLMDFSAINVTDSTFRPPLLAASKKAAYEAKDFPFVEDAKRGLLDGLHEWRAHFLSLCVKAAYEDEPVFADIARIDWKPFLLVKMLRTEDPEGAENAQGKTSHEIKQERRKQLQIRFGLGPNRPDISDRKAKAKAKVADSIIPQTRAFIIKNDHAVVLVFRGTEPTNLIQWATDGDCDFITPAEVNGRIHDGFYTALFFHSKQPDSNFVITRHCMFRRICELLYAETEGKKALYITGHSLGGALVSVMAHCIAKLAHDDKPVPGWDEGRKIVKALMGCIKQNGGVYTFAGPSVGDKAFREFTVSQYGTNIFRIVHAGDWVPQVPGAIFADYVHHTREYFLTTSYELLSDPMDIERHRPSEVLPLHFMANYIWKMVAGLLLEGESPVRTLERFGLMFIAPGLSDHWPSDYERKLRKYCLARAMQASAAQNGVHQHQKGANGHAS